MGVLKLECGSIIGTGEESFVGLILDLNWLSWALNLFRPKLESEDWDGVCGLDGRQKKGGLDPSEVEFYLACALHWFFVALWGSLDSDHRYVSDGSCC